MRGITDKQLATIIRMEVEAATNELYDDNRRLLARVRLLEESFTELKDSVSRDRLDQWTLITEVQKRIR